MTRELRSFTRDETEGLYLSLPLRAQSFLIGVSGYDEAATTTWGGRKGFITRDGIIRFVFALRINRFGLNEKVRWSHSPLVISDNEIYFARAQREKYLFRNICKEIIRRVSLLIYMDN